MYSKFSDHKIILSKFDEFVKMDCEYRVKEYQMLYQSNQRRNEINLLPTWRRSLKQQKFNIFRLHLGSRSKKVEASSRKKKQERSRELLLKLLRLSSLSLAQVFILQGMYGFTCPRMSKRSCGRDKKVISKRWRSAKKKRMSARETNKTDSFRFFYFL